MAELKVSLHMIKDGKTYDIDKVSEADKKIMAKRLGIVLSDYYTQHPEEFLRIGCGENVIVQAN